MKILSVDESWPLAVLLLAHAYEEGQRRRPASVCARDAASFERIDTSACKASIARGCAYGTIVPLKTSACY
jgi:hypothetical protein